MKVVAFLTLVTISISARSQSVSSYAVNSTGNSYLKDHVSIEWSVGESVLINSMQSDRDVTLTNGFLQPNLAFIPDSNRIKRFTAGEVRILPNPTYNKTEINFAVQQAGVLHIKVYDANGKLLHSSQLTNNGMLTARSVDLSAYASGTYLLKIDLVPQLNAIGKTGSYKITKL